MNYQFDELAKGMAQSVTRRAAMRKFGGGLAGLVLATLGMANSARCGGIPPDSVGDTRSTVMKGRKPKPFRCNCRDVTFGCESLPLDQQATCIANCSSICNGP